MSAVDASMPPTTPSVRFPLGVIGFGDLCVRKIETVEGKGKASKVLLGLQNLAKRHGFTGVKVQDATGSDGSQLAAYMVREHRWIPDGTVAAKKDRVYTNLDRNTQYDDNTSVTKVDSVEGIVPWMRTQRKLQLSGMKREFLIGDCVYVELQWDVKPRISIERILAQHKRAILPGSIYSI